MKPYLLVVAFVLVATPALAHHRQHHAHSTVSASVARRFSGHLHIRLSRRAHPHDVGVTSKVSGGSNVAAARSQGLPWCGAFMADLLGFHGEKGRELWLARNWAHEGQPTRPEPGAVVVWAHHVGKLVRQVARDVWIVLSGNDGHAVRERPRSISGAIAIRKV